jgi:hypothetical protein
MTVIGYRPGDDETRREKIYPLCSIDVKVKSIISSFIDMQQQTEFEKDMRRTPTSPSPRFSRTFDMLLSRVRYI